MYQENQHTLKGDVSVSGVGLHTGEYVNMTLKPAPAGAGIRFKRIDIEGQPEVKADVSYVTDTSRGTTIEHNGARASTIEHLLASFYGLGIDNAIVELDGNEVPILDGSAFQFIDAIEKVGLEELDAKRIYISIEDNIEITDDEKDVEIVATPSNDLRITTMIDFNSNVLGTQNATLKDIRDFKKEIAPCRTFCFLHELEALHENDLIKGGDLDNAIVVVDRPLEDGELERLSKLFNKKDIKVEDTGIVNNIKLHFPNEPARHKLLDVLGDISLAGYPLKANIFAYRPGHKTNVAFAKKLKTYVRKNKKMLGVPVYDPAQPPVFDVNYISKLLPHRYPFLLVDKIIELSDEHIVGVKNITFNEPEFTGHFPDNPIFPGVLQLEAMAQCGGVMALNSQGGPEKKFDTYFLKIDNAKFKRMVVPGDTLIMKLELKGPIRRGICEMRGSAYVGNQLACEADLMAQLVPRKDDE